VRISFGALRDHFFHEGFLSEMERMLADKALPAERLELRVAEKTFVAHDPNDFRRLQRRAVQIVVDEVGRGMSSLSSLARAPLWGLQLDRAWVTAVRNDPIARKVWAQASRWPPRSGSLRLRRVSTMRRNAARCSISAAAMAAAISIRRFTKHEAARAEPGNLTESLCDFRREGGRISRHLPQRGRDASPVKYLARNRGVPDHARTNSCEPLRFLRCFWRSAPPH
jgi:hypothetical protein